MDSSNANGSCTRLTELAIGMRHRLVHAYFDINLDILWKTIKEDLPPFIEVLEDYESRKET